MTSYSYTEMVRLSRSNGSDFFKGKTYLYDTVFSRKIIGNYLILQGIKGGRFMVWKFITEPGPNQCHFENVATPFRCTFQQAFRIVQERLKQESGTND